MACEYLLGFCSSEHQVTSVCDAKGVPYIFFVIGTINKVLLKYTCDDLNALQKKSLIVHVIILPNVVQLEDVSHR